MSAAISTELPDSLKPVTEILRSAEVPWAVSSGGQLVAFPSRSRYLALVRELCGAGFTMCSDLCGVDYLSHPGRDLPEGVEAGRFEVVVNLLDVAERRRVRIRVQLPEEAPVVDSLFVVYPGSEAMEREAYDMFGVVFSGHPDMTRILMPEDWEGHPLRKDYDTGSIPVRFKEAGVAPEKLVHTGRDREERLAEAAADAARPPAGVIAKLLPMPGRKR